MSLWVNIQKERRIKAEGRFLKRKGGQEGYLTRQRVFTQEGFIVNGKLWGIVIDVQHLDERDAFSDLGRVLWKRNRENLEWELFWGIFPSHDNKVIETFLSERKGKSLNSNLFSSLKFF